MSIRVQLLIQGEPICSFIVSKLSAPDRPIATTTIALGHYLSFGHEGIGRRSALVTRVDHQLWHTTNQRVTVTAAIDCAAQPQLDETVAWFKGYYEIEGVTDEQTSLSRLKHLVAQTLGCATLEDVPNDRATNVKLIAEVCRSVLMAELGTSLANRSIHNELVTNLHEYAIRDRNKDLSLPQLIEAWHHIVSAYFDVSWNTTKERCEAMAKDVISNTKSIAALLAQGT